MDNIKFFIRKNKICWHIGVSGERVVSMKVYEVMEQYKDYKFIIYRFNDEDCIFEGYNSSCKTWCLNLYVNYFYQLRHKTVVIFLY